jgi:ABC-type enterochelin transport system ATPase subunit
VTQNDQHAARLTVKETFDFAFQCRSGGTHKPRGMKENSEAETLIKKMDEEGWMVDVSLEGLGLSHVGDTFVGDADVRGVSGGQRRRVTVGEMMQSQTPIMCADEISNGLDAASTYDIIRNFLHMTKVMKRTRVVSLLQPSPETFGLFDEVILLSEGKLIYAGPTEEVVDYFQDLGYMLPARMDVADFLQSLSTPDGSELFHPPNPNEQHYTPAKFADVFRASQIGRGIDDCLDLPHPFQWAEMSTIFGDEENDVEKSVRGSALQDLIDEYRIEFQNSFMRSIWLTFQRQFTLWRRDRRFVIANFAKNLIMGISVGAVFWQTDNAVSIFGVMFQGMLFIMLGKFLHTESCAANIERCARQ